MLNLRRFVARHTQWNCGKGRFSFPHHFGGWKTRLKRRTTGCAHAFRMEKPEKVGCGCAGNPTWVCGGVLRAGRAQNPRFEKSKRGKFDCDFFAARVKNAFWNGARRGHISSGARGKGVARGRGARRATRRDSGGIPRHSPRRCRSTRSGLSESPGTGGASGTPHGVQMLSGEYPLMVCRHAGVGHA